MTLEGVKCRLLSYLCWRARRIPLNSTEIGPQGAIQSTIRSSRRMRGPRRAPVADLDSAASDLAGS